MSEALPKVPDFDRAIAAINELRRRYSPERSAAERAAREALVAKYPGQFVAYLDDWDGEQLNRKVLAAAPSVAEVHADLWKRPDIEAIRHSLTVDEIEDPNDDELWVPWFVIESVEAEPAQGRVMADLGFRADIITKQAQQLRVAGVSIRVHLEIWDGIAYGAAQPFQLDTGAEVTTVTAALARSLGLSTVGGRRVNLRGISGVAPGLLVPLRFRFARWPALEVTGSSCVVVPGDRERGLLALRDIHPRLEFFKVGNDLFFVPPTD